MWLTNSSIGRKLVMAVTGVCLVLFVTFHVLMNSIAIVWPDAYNQICLFLGANWYALVASIGLAVLFIIHIIYAVWLTLQNRAARGSVRYFVTARPAEVEWASKNMLVLGIVVLAFLVVHLIQFWAKMQLQELICHNPECWPKVDGTAASPALGTLHIQAAFSQIWTPIVYIIGFIALWFHMNHGFWSMFQSCGWNNQVWIKRLKTIGCWWTSIVVVLFIAQAIVFTVQANNKYYLTDEALQEQYGEIWNEQAESVFNEFYGIMSQAQRGNFTAEGLETLENIGKKAAVIDSCYQKQCPNVMKQELSQIGQLNAQLPMIIQQYNTQLNAQGNDE